MFVGGSQLQEGMTESSLRPASCNRLRCSKCDKKVVRFGDDVRWAPSVDYIFVRNYNTNSAKLREGTQKAAGFAAYACQCVFVSANAQTKVDNLPEKPRWHCGGH